MVDNVPARHGVQEYSSWRGLGCPQSFPIYEQSEHDTTQIHLQSALNYDIIIFAISRTVWL